MVERVELGKKMNCEKEDERGVLRDEGLQQLNKACIERPNFGLRWGVELFW